ncbi:type VI secretion system protein TssA [Pusillimonas noertemannii]|uniref:type VI secretion system protein TssA n=1 Tax=Pusillimonas noertemannii TaxID=305977 RepID=UPI00037E5FCB|nr:type VI secretion system protein TssA [Pusillimonas noertemannii]
MTTLPPLFASFDHGRPCGHDMEYSPEFLALQQAAVARPEQQFGATIIPAEAPDWTAVQREALALCERTCDVRVLALLAQAWTELRGLEGFAQGVELIASTLEDRWADIFPRLYLDDEYDPMPRVNALAALADTHGMGRAMRDSHLLDDVHGQITVRNAEALLDGSVTRMELYPGGRARLCDALRHAFGAGAPKVAAVSRALDALARIRSIVAREAGAEWAPDFSALERSLGLICALRQDGPAAPAAEADLDLPASDASRSDARQASARPEPSAPSWRDVTIESRDDALLALEQVCRYFDTHEPSHPAPLLIRRVQQTVPLNFQELLKNLAPQGVEQFSAWTPRSD